MGDRQTAEALNHHRKDTPASRAAAQMPELRHFPPFGESFDIMRSDVAADANLAGQMYPDQSLYPANSVPALVRRINQALQRADQIYHSKGKSDIDWFAPIVADARPVSVDRSTSSN
jgi:hypothetical protein